MSFYADYITERTDDLIIESPMGFATYRYLNDYQVYVVDLFVKKEYRKLGMAADMANAIAKLAKEKGCTEMLGTIVPSTKNSTASLDILRRYGMHLVSASNDLIIMKKEI